MNALKANMNMTLAKQNLLLFSKILRRVQYINDGMLFLIAQAILAEFFMKMYNNKSIFFVNFFNYHFILFPVVFLIST